MSDLSKLKQDVYQANMELAASGLVLLTWGNVSAFEPESGYVVIKPSGVDYNAMSADDMVVVDLNGNKIDGEMNPSSDTPTHIEIYKAFDGVKAIVHTHSKWATSFAQARQDIPCLGTTHADNFYGNIPCTRGMSDDEIETDYEKNTGTVIVETFEKRKIAPLDVSAVVVANHGPFSWGTTLRKAIENALVMEYVAQMAYNALHISTSTDMPQTLIDKHFLRKHGKNAYYGQDK